MTDLENDDLEMTLYAANVIPYPAAAKAIADAAVDRMELVQMVRRLTMNLRSVSLIGGSDERRTKLCEEADALVRRMWGQP